MDRDALMDWVRNDFGIEPEYPWADRNAVLRRRDNRKWFAAILEVRRDRLGLSGEEMVDAVNVKCDPRLIGTLVSQPGFHRAYHMNKEKWISIRLDGAASDDEIRMLVSLSYDLTGPKKSRKYSGEEC